MSHASKSRFRSGLGLGLGQFWSRSRPRSGLDYCLFSFFPAVCVDALTIYGAVVRLCRYMSAAFLMLPLYNLTRNLLAALCRGSHPLTRMNPCFLSGTWWNQLVKNIQNNFSCVHQPDKLHTVGVKAVGKIAELELSQSVNRPVRIINFSL